MTADGDISAIPPRFHKIIIARAKMYYAENEDAPEIMAGSLAEFEDLLDKLEADQLTITERIEDFLLLKICIQFCS